MLQILNFRMRRAFWENFGENCRRERQKIVPSRSRKTRMKPSKTGKPLPKSQLDFESLKLLDEAGFSRLSLAAEGILVTSKKARHTAICGQNSATFCDTTLEKAFFTRSVNGCISGVVVLDVRYYNSHFDSLAPTANCISQIGCLD